jgi:hypothetical protein
MYFLSNILYSLKVKISPGVFVELIEHRPITQLLFVCFWPDIPVSHGFLIHEVSTSHSEKPHLVGLLWTSDQFEAETTT